MRRPIAFILTLSFFACAKDADSFKLKGTAYGFDSGTPIYVYSITDGNQPQVIDTLTVENEKFTASYPKSEEVRLNYLAIENPQGSLIFFPENEDLTVTLYRDSINASFVSGSKQNELYTAFTRKMAQYNAAKQEIAERFRQARTQQDNLLASQLQRENMALVAEEMEYKKQFISENNNSLFALMLASEMLSRKELSATEAAELVNKLPPKIAATKTAADLKTAIASMKQADVGGQAPDFSAPSPSGEIISLKDTMGKYTIIDFWASWCKPCRIENPNVVKVYNKYHDKGLNIISVSLDREGQKDRWIKAIEDDKMDWYHVSNLQFWQDPIARTYNVRSIPATFLLDENGTIIAKDLRGPALENKIATLLGD